MSKSRELGMAAANKFGDLSGVGSQAALDPATIMTFAELIMQLMAKFKECKASPTSATQQMKNPGFFHKITLRRTVRDELGSQAFRQHGEDIVEALLDTGNKVTAEDVNSLYKELG